MLLAEPPLQAEIMINNSMMVSLTLALPDWTTNTSFSRTLVKIRTLVSPFVTGQPQQGVQARLGLDPIKAVWEASRDSVSWGSESSKRGIPSPPPLDCIDGNSDRTQLTLENWVSSASAGAMPKFSHI
ncbi:hypothetical protein CTA1_2223 [Colletotrichum tanaceti]|uniref:Uncharacterized protein n=1 Tax=Colletotrichum tanaceti TaxID=1306861 RepID=A0A4U6XND6_9PEZI|nr:hypothetical protein CTA1_2223 [Colletotrichum tanaceti]